MDINWGVFWAIIAALAIWGIASKVIHAWHEAERGEDWDPVLWKVRQKRKGR